MYSLNSLKGIFLQILLFMTGSQLLMLSCCRYYEFDQSVMREMLGKKLSSTDRKNLDDVSEKTQVQLKSCQRQFVALTVDEFVACSVFRSVAV